MKRLLVSLILATSLLGLLAPVQAAASRGKYQRVSSILSQVKQTEDLPNTVHKDPLVLKAVGLFLEASESENLSEDELHRRFRSLFPLQRWTEWVPQFEIKKVRSRLYLVSLGYAAVTQESSLYLFQGVSYLKIDSGDGGLIHVEDVTISDSQIIVTYVRTPGSTRPEQVTATLSKQAEKWQLSSRKSKSY